PSRNRVAGIARATLRGLRGAAPDLPALDLGPDDFTVVREYLGAAYGAVTEGGLAAQRLLLEEEGLALETTYTAKCLAALLDLATRPPYRDQTVLFWNTYSSVDPAAALGRLPDWRELPSPFHRFFSDRAQRRFPPRGRAWRRPKCLQSTR